MNNLSDTLSILIPMYNEETTIATTINELMRQGLHERYRVIVCDDASTDESVTKAEQVIKEHSNISVIINKPNGKKIGAIKTGLQSVTTPYVLLLDADSMIIELKEGVLDTLVKKMQNQHISAMGFKVRPFANNLIEYLQAIEYMMATDGLRKSLGVIVCLAGLGSLWEVNSLAIVLERHSGVFEGDDLESTMLATMLGYKVRYEAHNAIITTKLKNNLSELIKQRTHIWDVGLIRTFVDTPGILKQLGREGAFFRSVLVTEVLIHPFKIISMLGLFLVLLLMFMRNLDLTFSNFFVSRLNDMTLEILRATSWLYILLWLINTILIGLTIRSFSYGLLFIFYFTYYMATPLIPLMTGSFEQALGVTYLWWYAPCIFLILISIDSRETKSRALILGLLLPFYFAFLLTIPRTIGFIQYILGRMRGRYKRVNLAF